MQDEYIADWLKEKTRCSWYHEEIDVWVTPICGYLDTGVIAVWPSKDGRIQVHAIPTAGVSIADTLEALMSVSDALDGLTWPEMQKAPCGAQVQSASAD